MSSPSYEQFDFFEAERRKADGINKVWVNNSAWAERALRIAYDHLPHGLVMGEDFQKLPGVGWPSRPEAWGALVQEAKRRKIIRNTGNFKSSTCVSNHGHPYPVYWRDGFPLSQRS